MTNPYFNHYYASNEQDLIQDLVDESIYTQGIECAYIPKTQDNIDKLFNEDPTAHYDSFVMLDFYPIFVDGFGGQELMSMFGNEFQKSGTLVVSKRIFDDEYGGTYDRPREGDLLYMPVTNAVLEIKFVEEESPFFEKGKQYVWELKTEAFEYSYEDIVVGDTGIDTILDDMIIDLDASDSPQEPYAKNDDIQDIVEDEIEYDPTNPFGVL